MLVHEAAVIPAEPRILPARTVPAELRGKAPVAQLTDPASRDEQRGAQNAGTPESALKLHQEFSMRKMRKLSLLPVLAGCLAFALIAPAQAKSGCAKGAIVGGIAGHFAGHHGGIGAAAGCAYGLHEKHKQEKQQEQQLGPQQQPDKQKP